MLKNPFDEDYYERGPIVGVSCYSNYSWMPEKTMPAVMAYVDYLDIRTNETVLDFGCAKGYYVKALRLLHRDAWGCDISEYAISHADEHTRPYISLIEKDPVPFDRKFDYIIAKDVLEHMSLLQIKEALARFKQCVILNVLIIVPLAKDGKYIIPADEMDITHQIRYSKEEWIELFYSCNWGIDDFTHRLPGIKDHQSNAYPEGIGFFMLRVSE